MHQAFCWMQGLGRSYATTWFFQRHLKFNNSKTAFRPKIRVCLLTEFFSWVLIPPRHPGQKQNYPSSFFLVPGNQWPVIVWVIPFMCITCHFFFTPAISLIPVTSYTVPETCSVSLLSQPSNPSSTIPFCKIHKSNTLFIDQSIHEDLRKISKPVGIAQKTFHCYS